MALNKKKERYQYGFIQGPKPKNNRRSLARFRSERQYKEEDGFLSHVWNSSISCIYGSE